MCQCSGCNTSVDSTQGPQGNVGATGATGATGPAGADGASNTTPIILSGSGSTVLTHTNSGSTIVFNSATGADVTLPSTPTVGDFFNFEIITAVSSGAITVNAGSTATLIGYLFMKKSATIDLIQSPAAPNTHVTLTSTIGGLIGTSFKMVYEAANKWLITGQTYGTTTTSPFS